MEDKTDWNLNSVGSGEGSYLIHEVNLAMIQGTEESQLKNLTLLYNFIKGHKKIKDLDKIKTIKKEIEELRKIEISKPKEIHQVAFFLDDKKKMKTKLIELHGEIMDLLHESELWFTVFEKDSRKPIFRS